MRCGIDPGCHLWQWFLGWPTWAHIALLVLIGLGLWGIGARLWSLAKVLGGWQAAVSAVGVFALVIAVAWPRARRTVETWGDRPEPPITTKRRRPTIQDLFR